MAEETYYESHDASGRFRVEETWAPADLADLPQDLATGEPCDLFVGGAACGSGVVEHYLVFVGGMLVEVTVVDTQAEALAAAAAAVRPDVAAGLITAEAAARLAEEAAEGSVLHDAHVAVAEVGATIEASAMLIYESYNIKAREIAAALERNAPNALGGNSVVMATYAMLTALAHQLQDSEIIWNAITSMTHMVRALDARRPYLKDDGEWFAAAAAALFYGARPHPDEWPAAAPRPAEADAAVLAAAGTPAAVAERALAIGRAGRSPRPPAAAEWAHYLLLVDRLETLGGDGLARRLMWARKVGFVPLWGADTPRASTEGDLNRVIRKAKAPIASIIDYVYCVLQSVSPPTPGQNAYLEWAYSMRIKEMRTLCLDFGKNGAFAPGALESLVLRRHSVIDGKLIPTDGRVVTPH